MPNFNAARVQRIRDWLQALVDDDKYAGCLALVNCGGAEVLREGVGFFDREEGTKMPMDAIFRIMVGSRGYR